MKEDTRTISADSYFGKKNITKEEFVKRWSSPALTIWTLFQDHGATREERSFGIMLFEKTQDLAGRAFEKFYDEEGSSDLKEPNDISGDFWGEEKHD